MLTKSSPCPENSKTPHVEIKSATKTTTWPKAKNILFISGNFTVYDKLFDNTKTASINQNNLTLEGVNDGDFVELQDVQLSFLSPGIAINKTVIITEASLGGADAETYTLSLENAPHSAADILGFNYFGGYGRGDILVHEESLGLDGQLIYTWVGGTEGFEHEWFTNQNWCRGIVPSASDRIVITNAEYTPSITGDIENHLYINGLTQILNQSSLTLQTGTSLTILQNASLKTKNEAHIIIKDGASYINNSQSDPKLKLEQLLEGSAGWRNLSSPVKTTYAGLTQNIVTQGFPGSDFSELQPNLLWWHEADNGTTLQHWRKPENITDTVRSGRGHFHFVFNGAGIPNPDGTTSGNYYGDELPIVFTAAGYEYHLADQSTFNFDITFTPFNNSASQGFLNSNYIETNTSDIGWNLIGNPTASFLDWDISQGWFKGNIDNVIYIWDPNTNSGEYLTWNGVTGSLESGLISPFTAFWVKANDFGAYLGVNNSAKTIPNPNESKHDIITTNCHETIITITLKAHNMKTTTYIVLSKDDETTNHEKKNAYRLEPLTNTWLALYTNSSPENTDPLIINNLTINRDNELHIPLFVHALIEGQGKGGYFQLEWSFSECMPESFQICLMDHINKQAISMKHHRTHDFEMEISKKMNAMGVDPLGLPERLIGQSFHNGNPYAGNKQSEIIHTQPFSIVVRKSDHWSEPGYIADQPVLLPIYPNPFNDRLTIPFRLTRRTSLHIEVFDVRGHLLKIAASGEYPPGLTEVFWYAGNIPPGVYFIRLVSNHHTIVQKVLKTQ